MQLNIHVVPLKDIYICMQTVHLLLVGELNESVHCQYFWEKFVLTKLCCNLFSAFAVTIGFTGYYV